MLKKRHKQTNKDTSFWLVEVTLSNLLISVLLRFDYRVRLSSI